MLIITFFRQRRISSCSRITKYGFCIISIFFILTDKLTPLSKKTNLLWLQKIVFPDMSISIMQFDVYKIVYLWTLTLFIFIWSDFKCGINIYILSHANESAFYKNRTTYKKVRHTSFIEMNSDSYIREI